MKLNKQKNFNQEFGVIIGKIMANLDSNECSQLIRSKYYEYVKKDIDEEEVAMKPAQQDVEVGDRIDLLLETVQQEAASTKRLLTKSGAKDPVKQRLAFYSLVLLEIFPFQDEGDLKTIILAKFKEEYQFDLLGQNLEGEEGDDENKLDDP